MAPFQGSVVRPDVLIPKNEWFCLRCAQKALKWVFSALGGSHIGTSVFDCEQSTAAINLKPIPSTAPRAQLSGEVPYIYVSPFVGLPT